MREFSARLAGVELYFDNLERAKDFYVKVLGFEVSEGEEGHYTEFDGHGAFLCLERKGFESYPSRDKVALFFEVENLQAAVTAIGEERIISSGSGLAVLHDPEGHNILLLQKK